MRRIEWLVLATAVMLSACGMIPERQSTQQEPEADVTLEAGEIVSWIDHVGEMAGDRAQKRRDRLEPSENGNDRVRLSILEIYGPDPIRNLGRALARLDELLSSETQFRHQSARSMLALISDYERRLRTMTAQVGRLTGRLAEEQAEHAETYEKLEALRQIEEAMDGENQPVNGEPGEHDGAR